MTTKMLSPQVFKEGAALWLTGSRPGFGENVVHQKSSPSNAAVLTRLEWSLGILLTALLLVLVCVRTTHVGALWRDESAVVQLANMPSVADVMQNFQHEAFPPLFPLTIRGYTAWFGTSDTALRGFGLVIGCALIAAFWINALLFRSGPPLIGLALLSLNTTFLVWGTTIRGYGLGSVLIVLTFGFVGALLRRWSVGGIASALLVCATAVQILLYNSVLLCAIIAAAAGTLLWQRHFKRAFVVCAIGAIAMISVLPYAPAYSQARDWNILVRGMPTPYSLWKHFEVALGNPGYSIPAFWYSVAVALAGLLVFQISRKRGRKMTRTNGLIWYGAMVCGLGVIGCLAFLKLLSYTTSAWYYLALSCLLAAALDLVGSRLLTSGSLRWSRLSFAFLALMVAPFADWPDITERLTNVDLAAEKVATQAEADDLILVVPWQLGVTFQRYYHGHVRWLTIPNITDHRVHRYDLFKSKMTSSHPIDDLAAAIRATLVSGHRVWFVGGLNLPDPREGPMILPPAPGSRFKWDNRAYTAGWWQQLSVFAAVHAKNVESVPLTTPPSFRVNQLEQSSLTLVVGWQ